MFACTPPEEETRDGGRDWGVKDEGSRLARVVGRLGWGRGVVGELGGPVVGTPSSFEQVTRANLEALSRQVDRLETKLNGLLLVVVGAVLVDVYRTFVH